MTSLRLAIVLGCLVLAGCGTDSDRLSPAAFDRHAQTVEKTYGVALSRLVACMIDQDQHEPHPQFDVSAKAASFDLPGVFRMRLTAAGAAETHATVTAIPGDPKPGLGYYVGVLDRCAGR